MTRFNISLSESVKFVEWVFDNMLGSEIFVPKIKIFKVTDIYKQIKNNFKFKIIGIRPGEKIHEEMITKSDSINTVEFSKYYAILSPFGKYQIQQYCKLAKIKKVKEGFSYSSDNNGKFLTIPELKKIINKTIY